MLDPHRLAMTGDILRRTLFVFICEDDAKVNAGNDDASFLNSKQQSNREKGFLDWDWFQLSNSMLSKCENISSS